MSISSFFYSSSEDQVDSTSITSHASSSCPLGLPLPQRKSSFVNEDGVVLRKNSSKYNSTTNFSNADSSQRSSITTLADSESPKIQRLAKSGLYINPSDALKFFSTQVNFHQYAKYGTYWLWSFQTGGTKLERFLPQNQHTVFPQIVSAEIILFLI